MTYRIKQAKYGLESLLWIEVQPHAQDNVSQDLFPMKARQESHVCDFSREIREVGTVCQIHHKFISRNKIIVECKGKQLRLLPK